MAAVYTAVGICYAVAAVYTAVGICYASYADCLLAKSGISLADSQHNLYIKYVSLCIQY